jgi:hypothetical protein
VIRFEEVAVDQSRSSRFGRRFCALALAVAALTASFASRAAVFVSVQIGPPALPVYEQPLIPGPGYIWTPGYWAWGPEGYYWVPGTWVLAPFVGALWTPGYWGCSEGVYVWHAGYWGRHVGFYGGINYGFGYTGVGYQGGYWDHDSLRYNRAVNNVNITNITTYNRTVENSPSASQVSFNGGPGGVAARPTAQERIAERDRHVAMLPAQAHHELAASSNRELLASVNHGRPTYAASPRPQRPPAGLGSQRSFSQQAAAPRTAAPRGGNEPRREQPRGEARGPNGRTER